jgi:3-hydroxybutyryl-CoA dehydrogenase
MTESQHAVQRIAVIGAGVMGHGIAQVAAMAGFQVRLYDINQDILNRALQHIGATLEAGVQRGKVSEPEKAAALSLIHTTTGFDEAVAEADLVIEAAPEKLAIKMEIFESLDRACRPNAILATNTSSLSVADVASATRRPHRVVGMHFFNPPHILKLVEVIRHETTTPEVVDTILAVARRMKKEPIIVNDSPGFASSRLGVALGLEAMRMLEQGVASAEAIDRAMELGYNHPMGPLRLTDLVGLDVRLSIAEYLHEKLGSEVFRPPEILRRMVEEGKLGKKTGQGFYRWE